MKPWELNVINNIKGEGVYLYDITKNERNVFLFNKVDFTKYIFKLNSPRWIFGFLCNSLFKKLIKR